MGDVPTDGVEVVGAGGVDESEGASGAVELVVEHARIGGWFAEAAEAGHPVVLDPGRSGRDGEIAKDQHMVGRERVEERQTGDGLAGLAGDLARGGGGDDAAGALAEDVDARGVEALGQERVRETAAVRDGRVLALMTEEAAAGAAVPVPAEDVERVTVAGAVDFAVAFGDGEVGEGMEGIEAVGDDEGGLAGVGGCHWRGARGVVDKDAGSRIGPGRDQPNWVVGWASREYRECDDGVRREHDGEPGRRWCLGKRRATEET